MSKMLASDTYRRFACFQHCLIPTMYVGCLTVCCYLICVLPVFLTITLFFLPFVGLSLFLLCTGVFLVIIPCIFLLVFCFCCPVWPWLLINRHNRRTRLRIGEFGSFFGDLLMSLLICTWPCALLQTLRSVPVSHWDWWGEMKEQGLVIMNEDTVYFVKPEDIVDGSNEDGMQRDLEACGHRTSSNGASLGDSTSNSDNATAGNSDSASNAPAGGRWFVW